MIRGIQVKYFDISVTTNVALNKTVTSKSVIIKAKWDDLADIVDGDPRRDGETCACCAATAQQDNPWITVDLGKEFRIENVVVYGRTDDSNFPYRTYLILLHSSTSFCLLNALINFIIIFRSRSSNDQGR